MITAYRETHLDNVDAAAWNELARNNPVHTIYQTYEWHRGLWNVYHKNYQLYLICVKDQEKLIGVAPLMLKTINGLRTLFFIGHDRADYSDFLYQNGDKKILDAIFELLHDDMTRWDKIELLNIPEQSPTGPFLTSLSTLHHWALKSEKCADCSSWKATSPEDMLEITEKKSLRRHLKHYLNLPSYHVHHLTAKGDILPLMDEYFRQHIDRRYVTGTASLFLDPFVCDTYRSLIEALDRTGWLVMTVIRSQQRIIAFHFGYHYNGKLIWYKPSFDITEFKHSPGEVLLRELFEYAASTGCNEFDFTTGHEPFKDRFSNTTSANFIYEIYNTPDKTPKTEAPLNKRPRLIRRAGVILKKEGIKKGALKIWRIFLEKNFNHECVYLYTLPAAAPLLADIKPQMDNIIWRTADVKDLLRLDYFKNMDQKLEYYHTAFKRLTKGEQFKIVEQEGTIASFAWCARRDKTYIGEVETEMAFKEPAVVIYDCRTLPAYQNKNLYKFMLTMLINENPGIEKIIYCKKDNTPSRKGIESLFTLKLKLYYLRIFSLKLKWRG